MSFGDEAVCYGTLIWLYARAFWCGDGKGREG